MKRKGMKGKRVGRGREVGSGEWEAHTIFGSFPLPTPHFLMLHHLTTDTLLTNGYMIKINATCQATQ